MVYNPIDDQPRSGRHSTSRTDENVEKILKFVREVQHRTIQKLLELSEIALSTIEQILIEDLGTLPCNIVGHSFHPQIFHFARLYSKLLQTALQVRQ